MRNDAKTLRELLLSSGLSKDAVEAAWPSWWSDDAQRSASARAELRFTLARKLGLEPKALTGDEVRFAWPKRARFKRLAGEGIAKQDILSSFAYSLARFLLKAVPPSAVPLPSAREIRKSVLASGRLVDLQTLLSVCWGLGIPVIYLRVFPLETKGMSAMVVRVQDRHAILLARDASYPSPVAFTLAHELGHASAGHIDEGETLVDFEEDSLRDMGDAEEIAADRFALELLTGSATPKIEVKNDNFGGYELARAVKEAGPPRGIEPGILALCVAHQTNNWPAGTAALKHIFSSRGDAWRFVNHIAERQIEWTELPEETETYLKYVMGLDHA